MKQSPVNRVIIVKTNTKISETEIKIRKKHIEYLKTKKKTLTEVK